MFGNSKCIATFGVVHLKHSCIARPCPPFWKKVWGRFAIFVYDPSDSQVKHLLHSRLFGPFRTQVFLRGVAMS